MAGANSTSDLYIITHNEKEITVMEYYGEREIAKDSDGWKWIAKDTDGHVITLNG